MQNDIISKFVFALNYAHQKSDGTRETWLDAVERVEAMHLKKFSRFDMEDDIKQAFDMVKQKKVFPSQRSIQFGGRAIEKKNMRMFNCTFSYCDRIKFFAEAFYLLLCGSGVGFSVRRRHVERLPGLVRFDDWQSRPKKTYVIADNIEGWSNAVLHLLTSYFKANFYDMNHLYEYEFDYSLIRKKGAPISSGIGKAPGPEPLRIAIENIRKLLRKATLEKRYLSSVDCYDIVMYLSESVLSGGVRRSAAIVLFDDDDREMMESKSLANIADNRQRYYANISSSIVLDGNESEDNFNHIFENIKDNGGEPGVFFVKSRDHGTNPCAEIGLMSYSITDCYGRPVDNVTIKMLENMNDSYNKYNYRSGWSACNLSEINVANINDSFEFLKACRAAALIGTLQAAYTDVQYVGLTTKKILEYEALLGVSMTGMCSKPDIAFNEKLLRAGVEVIKNENKSIAERIGINAASRLTCIKPSGTASIIAGGVSSGIHAYHASKYIRRVTTLRTNDLYMQIKKHIPAACEEPEYSDDVAYVSFALGAPDNAITRQSDTAIDHLTRVKKIIDSWVFPGSENSRVEGLKHNVSNTCTIKEHEWPDVKDYVWKNREYIRGAAFMKEFAEEFPYLVLTTVDNDERLARWNELNNLDWSLIDFEAGGLIQIDSACSSAKCMLTF
jgi:ribonucleoside-diphosphate reductase alpha chain